jgi:hypothetical protein
MIRRELRRPEVVQQVVAVPVSLPQPTCIVLRYRFQTLWAAILAHGFNNTIGMASFYIAGPFYGLW